MSTLGHARTIEGPVVADETAAPAIGGIRTRRPCPQVGTARTDAL
ncbi:hypothetical protein [Sphaerisporangium dianthi]|uniref:Uncharacterized protein n=1 Tax=Sphaerisporangium dianthi TaxID=1436120 RepID=A0ABV9CQL7_9ACTN